MANIDGILARWTQITKGQHCSPHADFIVLGDLMAEFIRDNLDRLRRYGLIAKRENDDWRDADIAVLIRVPDQICKSLQEANINTLGELHDARHALALWHIKGVTYKDAEQIKVELGNYRRADAKRGNDD